MFSLSTYLFFIELSLGKQGFISKAIPVYPFRNQEKTVEFGAGGRHEGSFKDLFFWAKRSRDGREEDRASVTPIWAVLLRTARVQRSHHPLTGPASWDLWTTAVGLLTGPLLVIEFKSCQKSSMHFLQ